MRDQKLVLSPLGHTWIFDIDGTLVKHNGYRIDGHDTLLPGVKEFFENDLPKEDFVLLVTSRTEEMREATIAFLKENGIRFDEIVFGLPYGERILVNDAKPSGIKMSRAVDLKRDSFTVGFEIDETM